MPGWQPRNTQRAAELRNQATPAERALWKHLARSQQGAKFSRQMPIGPYYADFICRALKLVIEVDGHSHDIAQGHDRHHDRHHDGVRDAWMAQEGYIVLRFTNAQVVENVEGVVTAIRLEVERLRV